MNKQGKHLVIMAYGLNKNLTGIERLVVNTLAEIEPVLQNTHAHVSLIVDEDAVWVEHVANSNIEIVRVPRMNGRLLKFPAIETGKLRHPDVVHSFGPALPRKQWGNHQIYTICDWSPFVDKLSFKTAILWGTAGVLGIRRANTVNVISEQTRQSVPSWLKLALPCPDSWLVGVAPQTLCSPFGGDGDEGFIEGFPEGKFVLFVGSAVERKLLPELAAAAAEPGCPPVVLAGAGTQAHSKARNIIALGSVSDKQLQWLYGRCNGLVLASRYEGLGLPIMEAAMRGKRSVVSEQVRLCQPDDASDYLTTTDPYIPAEFAAALKQIVLDGTLPNYTPTSSVLLGLYERLLK